MTAVPTQHRTTTLLMTLWKHAMPIGICTLDPQGKLVVSAHDTSKQQNLERLIRAKYCIHAGFARVDQRPFTPELFLEGLPRYVRSTTMYASYPDEVDLSDDPQYQALEQYARQNTQKTPRPRVRRT